MESLSTDVSFSGKAHSPKVLSFLHEMGIGATSQNSTAAIGLFENKYVSRSETEISTLKEAIKKLEADKEAGLSQFYKLLKKASSLELRVKSAEEESRLLKEQAGKLESDEVSCLQKKLLEAEDHARKVEERARLAGDEVERLKNEVAKLEEEREVEVSSILEKMGSIEKLIDEKLSLEIEKSVVVSVVKGVTYDADQLLRRYVVLEKEKESLSSQVKELHGLIEALKFELGKTLDENEVLVLEKSVLLLLFEELKIKAAEAEGERKVLLENLNNESREVLVPETEAKNLKKNSYEHELELEDINIEFSEVRKSYQNLQTQMAKMVQENRVLRRDFLELKRQNLALYEDLVRQNELQLHETEKNLVPMQNEKLHLENSVDILNYSKESLSPDERKIYEAVDVELLKETATLERIITVEKAVDYMTTFVTSDYMDTGMKSDKPKTLAEELSYQCHCSFDDQNDCTVKHMTPQNSHIGLKMGAPLWGLKSGKSKSKASSVNSDQMSVLLEKESAPEKKHKGRIRDIGKMLHLKNYLHRSRSVSCDGEGQQKNKKKGIWSYTQSPSREESTR